MPYYTDIGSVYGKSPPINSAQATGINSTVVLGYIAEAENEINAKISKRYTLPLSNGCPILATLALREAIFRLCMSRGLIHFPPALQGRAPLAVQHDMDQKLLDKIMDGDVQLLDNSLAVIAGDTTQMEIYSTTMDFLPTFHEGERVDQVQDLDKLDSIVDDRQGRGL